MRRLKIQSIKIQSHNQSCLFSDLFDVSYDFLWNMAKVSPFKGAPANDYSDYKPFGPGMT